MIMSLLTKNTWNARGLIIHREFSKDHKSIWAVYRKIKNGKPSGFCFATMSLATLSYALMFFNEHIPVPIISDLAPTDDEEFEEEDPTEADRPNSEVEGPQDERPNKPE